MFAREISVDQLFTDLSTTSSGLTFYSHTWRVSCRALIETKDSLWHLILTCIVLVLVWPLRQFALEKDTWQSQKWWLNRLLVDLMRETDSIKTWNCRCKSNAVESARFLWRHGDSDSFLFFLSFVFDVLLSEQVDLWQRLVSLLTLALSICRHTTNIFFSLSTVTRPRFLSRTFLQPWTGDSCFHRTDCSCHGATDSLSNLVCF